MNSLTPYTTVSSDHEVTFLSSPPPKKMEEEVAKAHQAYEKAVIALIGDDIQREAVMTALIKDKSPDSKALGIEMVREYEQKMKPSVDHFMGWFQTSQKAISAIKNYFNFSEQKSEESVKWTKDIIDTLTSDDFLNTAQEGLESYKKASARYRETVHSQVLQKAETHARDVKDAVGQFVQDGKERALADLRVKHAPVRYDAEGVLVANIPGQLTVQRGGFAFLQILYTAANSKNVSFFTDMLDLYEKEEKELWGEEIPDDVTTHIKDLREFFQSLAHPENKLQSDVISTLLYLFVQEERLGGRDLLLELTKTNSSWLNATEEKNPSYRELKIVERKEEYKKKWGMFEDATISELAQLSLSGTHNNVPIEGRAIKELKS